MDYSISEIIRKLNEAEDQAADEKETDDKLVPELKEVVVFAEDPKLCIYHGTSCLNKLELHVWTGTYTVTGVASCAVTRISKQMGES